MRVIDVLIDMKKKFPNAPVEAWEPEYRGALSSHEGPRLGRAYRATMQTWTDYTPPKPGAILANIPAADKGTFITELWKRDDDRLKRVRLRTNELLVTAKRECAEYLSAEWGGIAHLHLMNLCRGVAELEEAGYAVQSALARINGDERRIACSHCRANRTWGERESKLCPPRPADLWIDAHDSWIFKARHESREKFAHVVTAKVDARKEARRAEINERILAKERA